jgi:hypothetical protein
VLRRGLFLNPRLHFWGGHRPFLDSHDLSVRLGEMIFSGGSTMIWLRSGETDGKLKGFNFGATAS